jgi:uncharacterized membrane protein YccF (DUF307 family)
VVVVYKVDRLTRPLANFAKLVELFEAHGVSFVSVTRQFNTTTFMGRLTLNVLLSFAQFEWEVAGERIRDKFAPSRRKGMWMGLPWTRAAFNIASYTLLPFGQKAVSRAQYAGSADVGTGPLGVLGNIVWLVLAGWWLALGHLITAILLAVTIVGIPFAWAHLKLAGIALWPIGKMIVPA